MKKEIWKVSTGTCNIYFLYRQTLINYIENVITVFEFDDRFEIGKVSLMSKELKQLESDSSVITYFKVERKLEEFYKLRGEVLCDPSRFEEFQSMHADLSDMLFKMNDPLGIGEMTSNWIGFELRQIKKHLKL